jgi:hypothetical protein
MTCTLSPVNVVLTMPGLAPVATPPSGGGLAAGNGNQITEQGQNPIVALALEPLPAFCAVAQGIGGIRLADITQPADRDTFLGVVVNSTVGGQAAQYVWGGPVVNTLVGIGGWNFLVNQPVYVAADSTLTQTQPVSGWSDPVGFAIASNAILLWPAKGQVSGASLLGPTVQVVSFASVINVDTRVADVFDLTLTGDATLNLQNGQDGRIITLRIKQDGVGLHDLTVPINIGGLFVPPLSTPMDETHYQFQYNGALDRFVCVSSVAIPL